jgi:hypothetical protein
MTRCQSSSVTSAAVPRPLTLETVADHATVGSHETVTARLTEMTRPPAVRSDSRETILADHGRRFRDRSDSRTWRSGHSGVEHN